MSGTSVVRNTRLDSAREQAPHRCCLPLRASAIWKPSLYSVFAYWLRVLGSHVRTRPAPGRKDSSLSTQHSGGSLVLFCRLYSLLLRGVCLSF